MKVPLAENSRDELIPLKNKTLRYRGTVTKISTDAYGDATYLLTDVVCLSKPVKVEHCWVTNGVHLKKANLKKGDIIEFDSTVHIYLKNGFGKKAQADFGLSTPKNIAIL